MPDLIMLKGLPASGKSTQARLMVRDNPNGIKRINKDDLRNMMDDGHWSKGNEKFVLTIRDTIIGEALLSGKHVISDDTNLHPKHEQQLRWLAKEYKANFVIEDKFLEVSPRECIERDLKRANSVGSDVIMGMYNQFLREPSAIYVPPEGKPHAIIVDIDGTLAHNTSGRSYYDWSRVAEDTIDETIRKLVNKESETKRILVVSGRDSVCRYETMNWLVENQIIFHQLDMRPEGDERPDFVIKKEIFDNSIRDHYHIDYVLDDRNQTVNMFRHELGLKVLQVAEGNF